MPAQPRAAGPVSSDGTYSGLMEVLVANDNQYQNSTPVHGFKVTGNRVRSGGFRGAIQPDGGLQMTYGAIWIVGQFNGPSFHDQV